MDEHETIIDHWKDEEIKALRRELNRLRQTLGLAPLPQLGVSTRRNNGQER